MSAAPKRRPSGNIAAQKFREKFESLNDHTIPLVQDLNARMANALQSVKTSKPPPPDPRREPGDEEAEPPVDVVELFPAGAPSDKKK